MVIRLREWATSRVFPLCAPRSRYRPLDEHHALQGSRAVSPFRRPMCSSCTKRVMAHQGLERRREPEAGWPADARGELLPGTRSRRRQDLDRREPALDRVCATFCARLIGWGDDRAAVVDQALRAIRLVNAGRHDPPRLPDHRPTRSAERRSSQRDSSAALAIKRSCADRDLGARQEAHLARRRPSCFRLAPPLQSLMRMTGLRTRLHIGRRKGETAVGHL